MKHILSKAAILLLVLSTTGCSDFLQKDPITTPSSATFWKEKAHFDYALTSCFSVAHDWPGVISQIIPCLDNLTDNSYCQHNEDTYGRTQTMLTGDITPQSSGYAPSLYSLMYKGIGRVQRILSELEKYKGSDISADQRKFYEAQCYAMRGYFYYWLYLTFNEVPIVTELLDTETMYKAKSPRAEVKAQVFADFDKAVGLMGDGLYFAKGTQGYMTKGAIAGLKARIMMYDAYTNGVADKVQMGAVVTLLETITGYTLSENWRSNFISMGQADNKEIMFSVRYLNPNIKNSVDLYYGAWGTNQITRDLVNEFEYTDGLGWGEGSPLQPVVDETILNKRPKTTDKKAIDEFKKLYLNRDKRLHETVNHSGVWGFKEIGFPDSVFTEPEGNNNFILRKMVAPFTKGTEPSYSTNSDPDIVIIRYGHILLMIAEAENEANGPTGKAYDAINQIRLRAGQPELPAGLSQDEFRKRVRKEWRVETVAEGLRYFHLKQWNQMDKMVTAHTTDPINKVAAVWRPAFMFWPLPQGEIDKAAGVLVQDPAYI